MADVQIYDAKQNKVLMLEKILKSDKEWREILNKKEYEITVRKGTESPGSCTFEGVLEVGIFRCVRCNTDLFRSSTKFESGTGWPSFFEPISRLNIIDSQIEVLARCGSKCFALDAVPIRDMFSTMVRDQPENAIA